MRFVRSLIIWTSPDMKNKSEFSSLNGGKETETMSAYFLNGITLKNH
jgi:hypothetical protein